MIWLNFIKVGTIITALLCTCILFHMITPLAIILLLVTFSVLQYALFTELFQVFKALRVLVIDFLNAFVFYTLYQLVISAYRV